MLFHMIHPNYYTPTLDTRYSYPKLCRVDALFLLCTSALVFVTGTYLLELVWVFRPSVSVMVE